MIMDKPPDQSERAARPEAGQPSTVSRVPQKWEEACGGKPLGEMGWVLREMDSPVNQWKTKSVPVSAGSPRVGRGGRRRGDPGAAEGP